MGVLSRKKPLDTVTFLECGGRVTTQTVTTLMASLVFCTPSSWSVVLSEHALLYNVSIPIYYTTPHLVSALALQRPINMSNAVTVAHQVHTYTLEAAGFTDSMDVLYVAQMMERFVEYVKQLREVRNT